MASSHEEQGDVGTSKRVLEAERTPRKQRDHLLLAMALAGGVRRAPTLPPPEVERAPVALLLRLGRCNEERLSDNRWLLLHRRPASHTILRVPEERLLFNQPFDLSDFLN